MSIARRIPRPPRPSRPSRPSRNPRPPRALLAVLVGALLLPACASRESREPRPASAPYAELKVDNDNPRIVTVYAIRSGQRMRLGTVEGVSTETFEIRQTMLESTGELRVLVEPLASNNRYFADPILVNEGDLIEITVSSLVR